MAFLSCFSAVFVVFSRSFRAVFVAFLSCFSAVFVTFSRCFRGVFDLCPSKNLSSLNPEAADRIGEKRVQNDHV